MNGNGPDLSGILKMVTENPAMLQTALSFAGKLKDSMAPPTKENLPDPPTAAPEPPPLSLRKEAGRAREDEQRLLLALRPYLGKARQEKIDFILKILQLLELAGNLGLTSEQKTKGEPPNNV